MKKFYKSIAPYILIFLFWVVFVGGVLILAQPIDVNVPISQLRQEVSELKEQISALQEQIFEIASKMPQNQFKVLDEDLPAEEKEIESEPESKVNRGAERNLGTPVLMRVTAYDLSYASCKKTKDHPEYGIGASGKRVKEYHSIAAGPELPFGTRVYIPALKDTPNSGIYTVEDRGSAIKENCLDIFMGESAYDECMEFGVQYLEVYILEEESL